MIVRVRYTWLRNLGARKKTQMNEVYFLAVSQSFPALQFIIDFLEFWNFP
jgi:hypothetical protein